MSEHAEVLQVLEERGFLKDVSDREHLAGLLDHPATVYWGCDATATSFHVGNQVGMMVMAWLQRFGHRPIILMGGGTSMVGDPSGKTSARPILTREEILANEERLRPQFERFIRFDGDKPATMVDNSDWLLELNLVEFLRDVGSKVTVNHMLGHETYRNRLEEGGLSFLEFSYQLLQGYDFLHLFRTRGCRFQIGGSDQWANILAGVDLIRRSESEEAFALVWPLLTTATGAKMGKTADGAIWLDATMLSPYEYYQFWINVSDADVERFLAVFTFLPMAEIRELGALPGERIREAKERLAFEVTALVHGSQAAEEARTASRALFQGQGRAEGVPTVELSASTLDGGCSILDLLDAIKLYPSRREAHRKITEGGLYLNGTQITSPQVTVTEADVQDGELLVRAGKKRYLRVRVAT